MTAAHDDPTAEQRGDPDLITAVRAGDPDAFATLYTRHAAAARRLAMALARSQPDADDLVAEAFAKLLSTLRDGRGPNVTFRAYLLTTVRNLFYDRTRREQRVRPTDDLSRHDAGVPFVDTAVEGLEHTLVARAFARLPERWQTVLWHTEVEGESPATVAPLLDLTPNGVSALAYRARERLRQNYLREHVTTSPTDACQTTVERLGAYVRSGLSQRDRNSVDDHLSGCRRCQVLYLELGDVNTAIPGLLAPVVLGEAAVAYLGSSSGGLTAILTPIWSGTKQISRRRSTQVGAAGAAVVAAAVALALVLTSSPSPEPEPEPPAGPEAAAPGPPAAPDAPATDQPTPEPAPEPAPGSPTPAVPGASPPEPAPAEPVTMAVTLEPVGALILDRPGVLALTVAALDPAGGAGGEAAAPNQGLAAAQPAGEVETGPLAALITVPDGVGPRTGEPGGGWSCDGTADGIRCQRASLDAGTTSVAYVPVDVAATATDDPPRVRLTGPGIEATGATAPRGVQSDGLAARLAGILPATVVAGGNSLLSCPRLDLTCAAARKGKETLRRADNDYHLMARYASARAPAGDPRWAAASGATIDVPGEVVWAGLYWAGSGKPPRAPTAYLRAPGGYGYATVEATTVRRVGEAELGQVAYQASADVTELVRAGSGDDWWVAVDGDAFASGFGAFGGWALVVVAEDGGPDRTVAVFDELTPLRDRQSFSATVHGNPGEATIGFVAWEGDRGLTGDRLQLDGGPFGDAGNAAASRADGTHSGWHTFGTDVRVLDTTFPDSGQPTLTASTGRDAWLLGPVVVITPPP